MSQKNSDRNQMNKPGNDSIQPKVQKLYNLNDIIELSDKNEKKDSFNEINAIDSGTESNNQPFQKPVINDQQPSSEFSDCIQNQEPQNKSPKDLTQKGTESFIDDFSCSSDSQLKKRKIITVYELQQEQIPEIEQDLASEPKKLIKLDSITPNSMVYSGSPQHHNMITLTHYFTPSIDTQMTIPISSSKDATENTETVNNTQTDPFFLELGKMRDKIRQMGEIFLSESERVSIQKQTEKFMNCFNASNFFNSQKAQL